MFIEQQISILELFLKDHVTLKTGEIELNFSFSITGIHNISKYIKVANSYFKLK